MRQRSLQVCCMAFFGLLALTGHPAFALSDAEAVGCVALTFDDGPDATLTPQLLAILERENVVATFFLVGSRVADNPALVRRESAHGDEIGNHTFDHRLLPSLTDREVVDEIARTDEAIIAITGYRPGLIRPPYGIVSDAVEQVLSHDGLMRPMALWDVDTFDWLHEDAAWTVTRASQVAVGSIVLMHDIHAATILAVPEIIRALKARRVEMTTVSDLANCQLRTSGQAPGATGLQDAGATALPQGLGIRPVAPLSGAKLVGNLLTLERMMKASVGRGQAAVLPATPSAMGLSEPNH